MNRITLAAASVAMVALAACSKKSQPLDASLKADLAAAAGTNANVGGDIQLAPGGASSRTVVSAIEGGPVSAPKRASAKPVNHTPRPKPQPKAQTSVAQNAPAPAATPEPAPSAPVEAPAPAPRPQPQPAEQPQQRQRGTYSTEADIFRRMPWIRP